MRVLGRSQTIFFAVTLTSVAFFGGCQWFNPAGVDTAVKDDQGPPAPVVVDGTRTSYSDIVQKTSPAVVQITAVFKQEEATQQDGFNFGPMVPGPQGPQRGAGSGVIVNDTGTIITNFHVIDNAKRITIKMSDNKTFEAEVVGSDKPSDLAVIKIKGEKLPFLKLGDSDRVRVGDIVLAIGNPLGIGQTVTSGIISAKSRRTPLGDGSSFQDFLQTDAPINQGNSGGALVNVNGELIGINSQIMSRDGGSIGIGFAVPSNMAKTVMDQLIKTGKVRRGMLGVNIQDVDEEIAQQFGVENSVGVIVSAVKDGGAAANAGIKRGDVITEIDGEKVTDGNFLRNKVASTMPGTEVSLSIVRDKKPQTVKVKLDEFDIESAKLNETESGPKNGSGDSKTDGKLGITVQPLTPELSTRFRIPSEIKGLIIAEIDPAGPAAEAGLLPGDVIMEVNRQPVAKLEEMRDAIGKNAKGSVLLLVNRKGQTIFLTIKP